MSRLNGFDEYIQAAMQTWDCPGVALSIVQRDEILLEKAYGLQDVGENLPMTINARFAMASVTKSFTAMSVALLIDDGKLEWDKPVREYIPELILDDPYVTEHITVRDMLSHRTGLPRHDWSAWRRDLPKAEYVKEMRNFKFSASFREKFQYNNLMYYVTAHLVETLAGKRWEDFIDERIFAPLGMEASNFIPDPPKKGQINAKGYRVERDEEGKLKELINTEFGLHTELSPGAAGALFSTLADLTRWLKVHVNEGKVGNARIVSPDNLKQMHLPQMIYPGGGVQEALFGNTIFTYGMGWFIEPYRGYTLIHHGGNVEGHSLIIGFVPQKKLGVVALTNIGLLPLRDVLLYESIDRVLDLPDQDWNKKFHEIFDPMIAGEAKAKLTASDEKIDGAPTTHPTENYLGVFEADGYPDFSVRESDGKLEACTVGSFDWSTLKHYHYNIFEWHMADFDIWMKVKFQVSENGDIDMVSIPLEPEVENIVFTRKLPDLDDATIAALVGEYDLPIDGIAFTITAHDGKIYATETGTSARELTLYKVDDHLVGFMMERIRLDFMRENGKFSEMIFKGQYTTLEGKKIS